jgi:sigma-E factor negative regulatory protein RseA
MKHNVSALLDGELEAHEGQSVFAALRRDGELRETWSDYQTIGAAMRREEPLARDITARVMAGLDEEPTIIAPQPRRAKGWDRPLMALAASAAGVAVVGWMALSPQFGGGPGHSVEIARGGAPEAAKVALVTPAAQGEMQQYLVAHQAHASPVQLHAMTQQIRTVSASGGADRR